MPDVDDNLRQSSDFYMPEIGDSEYSNGASSPSILGIWRVGETLQKTDQSLISLGQPADSTGSPRWDYVIKTFPNSMSTWTVKRHVTQVAAVGEKVTHPNLIGSLDASSTSITPYLVMPRLHAVSMQSLLTGRESKPLPVALWVTRQISEALMALHQAGWIHGNITPNHIMLQSNGHATLIDLGMTQKTHTSVTRCQGIDRKFASPESLSGEIAAMPAMDIFSLGRILWQWLTVATSSGPSLLEQVAMLVEAMLSPDPNDRPEIQSVVEQLKQLEFAALERHIGPSALPRAA